MNGGNNPGVYVTVPAPSGVVPKYAIETSNPAWTVTNPTEKSVLQHWFDQTQEELFAAFRQPDEALKGAVKGLMNNGLDILEFILKGGARTHAIDIEDRAIVFGGSASSELEQARQVSARKLERGAERLALPKFELQNQAQSGGDTISTLLQLMMPSGIVKAGPKWIQVGANLKPSRISKLEDGVKVIKTTGPRSGLRTTAEISPKRAEEFLTKNGLSPQQAKDYVNSFEGPITARIVRADEGFLRYTDIADSKGSFLTKTLFDSPTTAVEALYLGPYGNNASLIQHVISVKKSIVLEGGIANGGRGVRQSLIVNRSAFTIEKGSKY